MAKYDSKSLRNVVVVGHGSTGKTSLCESFLFVSGKTDRLGRVDEGTSTLDHEPEEQKKRISISSATTFVDWQKFKINLIDTPGDSNFSFDTQSCLRIADAAIIVLDAVSGVEFQTQKVWEYADDFKLPRMVFINRMDRERANFQNAVASIKEKMDVKVTPICLPIGTHESFRGVIDLLSMQAIIYDDLKGTFKTADIPADQIEEAQTCRETMVEDIAESDEAMMDRYLEAGELTPEELRAGLRTGVNSGALIPVACGSALKNMGTSLLMDIITQHLPSPVDRGPAKGVKPGTEEEEIRTPEEGSPFSALVFKTIADPYAGRLTLFRVYSGTLTADVGMYNASHKISERFGNIFFLDGKTQKPTDMVIPGDIAAFAKLKETGTGDTICNEKSPIIYDKVVPPPTIMSFAIEPKSRGDEDKIGSSISRLIEEDPTMRFHRDDQTKEMIISGMGQIHIEVAMEKMRRKFGVEVNLKTPKVPYKETIKAKTNVQGKYLSLIHI